MNPILIVDSEFQIQEVNRGFETVFKYSTDEIMGKNLNELNINLNREKLHLVFEEPASEDRIPHEEMQLIKPPGTPFIAEVAISRITIHSEPCLIIQIHDIDEIKKAHDTVAQVNQKLQILSSITRHDILNRVMVISAYSEIIKDDVSDSGVLKRLEAIVKSSGEISTLIGFTREYQDLGIAEPAWQEIDIILKSWLIQGMITGIELDSTLGDLEIYADKMLEKVIYNLIENSIRHGQNLTWIRFSENQDGDDMIIWYEDNGGGVIQEEKDMIFNKGFGKNTGMGLFLIREILSITNIEIIENGTPGVGVRFEIRVPAGKYRH